MKIRVADLRALIQEKLDDGSREERIARAIAAIERQARGPARQLAFDLKKGPAPDNLEGKPIRGDIIVFPVPVNVPQNDDPGLEYRVGFYDPKVTAGLEGMDVHAALRQIHPVVPRPFPQPAAIDPEADKLPAHWYSNVSVKDSQYTRLKSWDADHTGRSPVSIDLPGYDDSSVGRTFEGAMHIAQTHSRKRRVRVWYADVAFDPVTNEMRKISDVTMVFDPFA